MQARATIVVPIRDRAHFLEMYSEKGANAGVFVPGDFDVELGKVVDIELHFVEEDVVFRLRGQVRWRRTQSGRASQPRGVSIEFLPEDLGSRRLLLDFVNGEQLPLVERAARRYGVSMPARYRGADGAMITEVTDDLSEGGAFIRSEHPPEVGRVMKVKLLPDRSILGVGVKAVVAWRRTDGRSGFGVEFLFDGARKRDRVLKLVSGLRDRILREVDD
jgi:Tfp pilus assembly protein PilZ